MNQWDRRMLGGIFGASVICLTALTGCSPLPGPSLDPMYWKVGAQGAMPAQAGKPAAQAPPPAQEPPRVEARASATSVWTGRYQDSRGAGEITFSLVRGQSMISGTWKLRTGGGGPLTGVVQASGRRLDLRMENIAPECPAMFEGAAEISETVLIGTYRGKDCEGTVTDGRLELHPRQP